MSTGASCDISGLTAGLKLKEADAIAAAVLGVSKFGQKVIGNAQQFAPVGGGKYSPNDPAPGTLAASGVAEPATIEGTEIVCVMGFNTVYAAIQHEELEFRHEQGQAKYLEAAMREATPRFAPFVGAFVKAAVER